MSLLKIIANDYELDSVKETLNIKKENNALSAEFKVSHSSVPFLIVENDNCKQGLGTRDLASVKKKKVVEVVVFEGNDKYYGEIQILSYLNGYRKCNLKYSTELLKIFNKKISDFMPVISVIDDPTPQPYVEESESFLPGTIDWTTFPMPFLDKSFPEVTFQFPSMVWKNKFGERLQSDDPWYKYRSWINLFSFEDEENPDVPSYFVTNGYNYTEDPLVFNINNLNVASPQVFLLSILHYVLESIGFKAKGDFTDDPFIQKLLVLSTKDNLTKVYPGNVKEDAPEFEFLDFTGNFRMELVPEVEGKYAFYYYFEEPDFTAIPGESEFKSMAYGNAFDSSTYTILYKHYAGSGSKIYSGVCYVDISQIPGEIYFLYITPVPELPTYQLEYQIQSFTELYQLHPTIELGRYVPDWTVGTYFNEIKKLFNLNIEPDDFKKEVNFNFVNDFMLEETKFISTKSLRIENYEQAINTAYIVKYENSEDTALYITKEGVEVLGTQTNSFTGSIESKFKFIPNNGNTTILSEDVEDKEGVGLMIYDPINLPFSSASVDGKNLRINGDGGIYETYHKIFIKFKLNAGLLEVSGPFTESEITNMLKLKKIFLDNQAYIISSFDYSETVQNNFILKIKLESVNY